MGPCRAVPCLLLGIAVAACSPEVEQVELFGETMGTTFSVKVVGEHIDESALAQRIEAVFEAINAQMSTWRQDSEISRFNRVRTREWFQISEDFMRVLASARRITQQTGGAFDVTVTGLVKLWGFGSSQRQIKVPSPEAIAEMLSHTGPGTVEIDASRGAVRKVDPAAQLDLSGIAKGYAVDAVAGVLEEAGLDDFLVEIGGEIRASGERPDGGAWRVAIEKPDSRGRSIQLTLPLVNAALATSGDYRRYFDVADMRYSHIIDPRTGNPVDNSVASVSVVAGDTMTADALATGLMVMGTEKALALAARNKLAVMIIKRDGSDYRVIVSADFDRLQSIAVN